MKPYKNHEPRSHSEWCQVLGLACEGSGCNPNALLTYDEFCFLPETTLTKVSEGPLYGFWREYGDIFGEARTIEEWLNNLGLQIVEPVTEQDIKDLNLFLGYDEFMHWAGGKVDFNSIDNSLSLLQKLKNLFASRQQA